MGFCCGLEFSCVLTRALNLYREISLLLSSALNLTSEISLFLGQFSSETALPSCYSTYCLYDLAIQGNPNVLRYGGISLGYYRFPRCYTF